MACRRRIAHGEVLPILRYATPYFGKSPCAVAAATAASRVETESLERTEETWWSYAQLRASHAAAACVHAGHVGKRAAPTSIAARC